MRQKINGRYMQYLEHKRNIEKLNSSFQVKQPYLFNQRPYLSPEYRNPLKNTYDQFLRKKQYRQIHYLIQNKEKLNNWQRNDLKQKYENYKKIRNKIDTNIPSLNYGDFYSSQKQQKKLIDKHTFEEINKLKISIIEKDLLISQLSSQKQKFRRELELTKQIMSKQIEQLQNKIRGSQEQKLKKENDQLKARLLQIQKV